MFTIHRSDGNLFLARPPRQSGPIKKNAPDRDIHATVCLQSGGIRGFGRGICATLQQYGWRRRSDGQSADSLRNINPWAGVGALRIPKTAARSKPLFNVR
jgi:hypothetical protein